MGDVNLLSNVDEELEEIKKLLEGDSSDYLLFSEDADSARVEKGRPGASHAPIKRQSGLDLQAEPRSPGAAKPGSGLPAVRKTPGPPQPKQVSGVPAVRQRPGAPQPKQAPGAPAVRQKPGTPQPKQAPGGPAVYQKRQPPAQLKTSGPSEIIDDAGKIRSYDISESGKITKSTDAEPEPDIGPEKFKVKFDFESAYKDVPEERPLRFRREKRTGCIGGVLYGAFVISISLILAALMWMAVVDVMGFGAVDELINITVPTGFVIEDITDMLFDAGLIKYKFLFNIYAGFSSADEKITAGSYVLNRNFDYRAIVQGMTAREGKRVETSVTIPEGFTLAQIFTLLEDYGVCPASELWDSATNYDFNYSFLDKDTIGNRLRLEGFLFPETHNFYINSTPVQVLSKLLREFNLRFTEDYVLRAEDMGYSTRDIVIIASMIEREAGDDEERPRIAAVIYNRLESKDYPMLQIDATIQYAIAGTGSQFSIDIDHPYNTYLHEGLPPGPISNPGMASIRAALYPDSTNEYFYALNKEGTHTFFKTLAQHEAFVKSGDYGG